jgi:hypothetical protein
MEHCMNAHTPIETADAANMPKAIAEAIGSIMGKVKNVEKHGTNTFHNYKFAKVEDLMFQVQPAMVDAGLVITQDEVGHEIVADTLMLATYAFSLSHKSGVTWGPVHQTGMSNLRNTKGGYDDKALNKCHTAARKYFILGLFQIPAGDLPDADTEEDKPAPERRAERPEPKRTEPKALTLSERADAFVTRLKAVGTAAELKKAYDLGAKLCADLDASDPERLAEVNALYEARAAELSERRAAA